MHDASDWLRHEREVRDRMQAERTGTPRPYRLIERSPEAHPYYFVLRHGEKQWLGRKFVTDAPSGSPMSNQIRASHLLGDRAGMTFQGNGIVFDFILRPAVEAAAFLRLAAGDPLSDLVFPFPARAADGNEIVCPPSFWARLASKPACLAKDELPMRSLCADTLTQWLPPGAVVRDPACSTGDFVAAMADACPLLRFEGADVSTAMIETATTRHAGKGLTFAVADAAGAIRASCDGLILRFLNAEVVTSADAATLFDRLVSSVRPGGVIVLFGHSPLLVPVRARAAVHGLRLVQCSAALPDRQALVQYYVLVVPGTRSAR